MSCHVTFIQLYSTKECMAATLGCNFVINYKELLSNRGLAKKGSTVFVVMRQGGERWKDEAAVFALWLDQENCFIWKFLRSSLLETRLTIDGVTKQLCRQSR